MSSTDRTTRTALAAALAVVGLVTGGFALSWVVGSLGISTAAATQIVDAVMAGGLALTIVMAIFGGGIISAIAATVRYMVAKKGRKVAIA